MSKKLFRKNNGFTLLEMIISIGIFLTALTIIFGALISLNDAARKTRSVRITSDNISAAVDMMSRTIRVGGNFHCGCSGSFTTRQDCPMTDTLGGGGDVCLAFEGQQGDPDDSGDQVVYRLSGGSLQRSTDSGFSYLPLTAPELSITHLKFFVYGTALGDQPVVTMLIRGAASTTARTSTTFDLQTTVSAYTPNF